MNTKEHYQPGKSLILPPGARYVTGRGADAVEMEYSRRPSALEFFVVNVLWPVVVSALTTLAVLWMTNP